MIRSISAQSNKIRSVVGLRSLLISSVALGIASCATPDKAAPQADLADPMPEVAKDEAARSGDKLFSSTSQTEVSDDSMQPVVVQGTGRFYNAKAMKNPGAATGGGSVSLNFSGAEIRDVAQAVFGTILKVNFMVDPKVAGSITVNTSEPIDRSAVLPTIESIFRLNGAAIIHADNMYKVVPLEQAIASGAILRDGSRGDLPPGYSLTVMPVRYVGAAEMVKILEPIAPNGTIVQVDEQRNLIVLAGTSDMLNNLMSTARVFDVDWMAGMSFAIVPVETPDIEALVDELMTVFGSAAGDTGLVKFLPIDRLNSVMVLTTQPKYLEKAQEWVERLDRGDIGSGQRLYIYNVQHGNASDFAELLNEMFSEAASDLAASSTIAPGLTETSIGGNGAQKQNAAGAKDNAQEDAGNSARRTSDIRVIADEANNALLIMATPGDYRLIESSLKKLDVRPMQVLIEATIVDVTLTDDLQYGVQWFLADGKHQGILTEGESLRGVSPSVPGFSWAFADVSAKAALSALSSVTDVEVLSRPTLTVLDNQSANLQVGDQVPIIVQDVQSAMTEDSVIRQTVEYKDTGLILTVKPRVNENGQVTLEIDQEASDAIATTTSGLDTPTIRQRKISTTIVVDSGETIVLGGMIRESDTKRKKGVPLLMKMPVVGNAFKSTDVDKKRAELVILLTPRVLRTEQDVRDITAEMKSRARALQNSGFFNK